MQNNEPTQDNFEQVPRLSYTPYCLLLVWMDAHFTRAKSPPDAFNAAFDEFAKVCENQRNAQAKHRIQIGAGEETNSPLFIPHPFVPLGRADLMAAILLDSIDECQSLMATTDRTIEEATMAFCLQPESLCCTSLLNEHLVDVQTLLTPESYTERPLLMVARLKLEGLPLLLDPILVQAEAITLCLHRMAEAWHALQNSHDTTGENGLFNANDLATGSWKMAVIDLQEEEEIGLLFSCSNLSVPTTLLSAIRGLTLRELCQSSPRCKALFEGSVAQAFEEQTQKAFHAAHPEAEKSGRDLHSSHLFRWSRSSVALSLDSYRADARGVNGWSASLALVSFPPGHHLDGLETTSAAQRCDTGKRQLSLLPNTWRSVFLGSVDVLAGSIVKSGGNSWLDPQSFIPTSQVFIAVAELCRSMDTSSSRDPDTPKWPTRHVTAWNTQISVPVPGNLATADGRPINTDYRRVEASHFPFLLAAISNMPERLFRLFEGGRLKKDAKEESGRYLIYLREAFGFLGLPMTLRRAFYVLFSKYVSLAKHPMRYDSVLDLHDVMHTLWRVLTEHLPKFLWPEFKDGVPKDFKASLHRRLNSQTVDFLSELASAIESAIDLRLRRSLPDTGEHEWDLDYRGSLNQVVIAGETVLRAALGIVRRNVLGDVTGYDKLGVVNRLTITSSITSVIAGLGVEHKARLAYTDTDVSHLSHLVQLTDYFHEAFHLIHAEMRVPVTTMSDGASTMEVKYIARDIRGTLAGMTDATKDGASDRFVEMSGEIFVAMMMLLIIADGDLDLLWSQQAQTYATSPISTLFNPDDGSEVAAHQAMTDMYDRFGRVFVPLGVATCLVQSLLDDDGKLDFEATFVKADQTLDLLRPSAALRIFEERCASIMNLLPEDYPVSVPTGGVLGKTEEGRHQRWSCEVARNFDECWGRLSTTGVLQQMWSAAVETMRCFVAQSTKSEESIEPRKLAQLWRALVTKADVRINQWTDSSSVSPIGVSEMFSCFGSEDWNNHVLGTVFIVRGLHWVWSQHLPDARRLGIEWRLPRGFKHIDDIKLEDIGYKPPTLTFGGMVPYLEWDSSRKYADHLIDPVRPEGFCLRPAARRQRLHHQAVFLKTLWGLSSIIRRRRLEGMLTQVAKFG